MSSYGRFAESLVAGQLTFASNMAVRKYHVVRLHHSAFDDDVANLSKFLSRAKRAEKIAEVDPGRHGLWQADRSAYAGVRAGVQAYCVHVGWRGTPALSAWSRR